MKPRATVLGRELCTGCRDVAIMLKAKGYQVEELDLDLNIGAKVLFAELDGDPDNLPLVILRGVPDGGL